MSDGIKMMRTDFTVLRTEANRGAHERITIGLPMFMNKDWQTNRTDILIIVVHARVPGIGYDIIGSLIFKTAEKLTLPPAQLSAQQLHPLPFLCIWSFRTNYSSTLFRTGQTIICRTYKYIRSIAADKA